MDADTKQKSIKAGSAVLAMGMKGNTGQALMFHGTAARFFPTSGCQTAADDGGLCVLHSVQPLCCDALMATGKLETFGRGTAEDNPLLDPIAQ